jgi:cobalt-zinc-cadmium efflux system membrane fusion protein
LRAVKSILVVLLIVAAVVAVVLIRSGTAQTADSNPTAGTTPASNAPPSQPTVDLTSNQLNAIKIEPVQTYRFPIVKETVGSVSFDEDPSIVQAESTLIGAAATFQLDNKELMRARSLGVTNGISPKELEQATSDQQTAAAALKAARETVRALGKTDAEIDQMIASGRIGSRHDTNEWVVANVIETDSPVLQPDQPVEVKVMAFPDQRFAGRISKVYATVDPNTHRQEVRCQVDDPKHQLRPGMFADVTIQVQDPVESTAVPVNGVVREGDGTMTAWVTSDNHRFAQRLIKTGLWEDGRVQVLDGLAPGEQVVSDGAIYLDNLLQAPPSD